ncbi:hypothetical protein ACSU1N_03160 [Thermogladius sp. 4427co]|uniref:hypothetical protein n=1 Tax=Thermogladius sp. 4427co TaxID=3450718 RepID=UPI003F79C9AB
MLLTYELSSIICLLIIALVILSSLFKGRWLKISITLIGISTIILNYLVFYLVSENNVSISILPLFIIESTSKGSSISPDIGQIIALSLIVLWRRELSRLVRRVGRVGDKDNGVR